MCLITNNKFPKITTKPIKVYKIVEVCSDKFRSCFISGHDLFEINTEPIFPLMSSDDTYYDYSEYDTPRKIVKRGYIHSFTNPDKAIRLLNYNMLISGFKEYSVIECIIPRFTFYFIGNNEDICSKELIIPNYDEVLKRELNRIYGE